MKPCVDPDPNAPQSVESSGGLRGDLAAALSVYLLTDPKLAAETGRSVTEIVRAAIEGGVTAVQLRAKEMDAREQWRLGLKLREMTADSGILFFVNDRVDLALALEADGVHLGEEDLPVAEARRLACKAGRPGLIIGFSTAVLDYARQAVADGASYVSVGNLFGTTRKADAGDPVGTGPLATIARALDVPVIGIGGVTAQNAPLVIEAGGVGVAVISSVAARPDPAAAARALAETVAGAKLRAAGAKGRIAGVKTSENLAHDAGDGAAAKPEATRGPKRVS